MTIENEKRFYIDFNTIKMLYPKEVSKPVTNFGVLEKYKDKKYTMKEINEIIAELVVKRPFISNSMNIHINVMGIGYHHMLDIKNYNYDKQKRTDVEEVGFLY